jgi:hypothetical protein
MIKEQFVAVPKEMTRRARLSITAILQRSMALMEKST